MHITWNLPHPDQTRYFAVEEGVKECSMNQSFWGFLGHAGIHYSCLSVCFFHSVFLLLPPLTIEKRGLLMQACAAVRPSHSFSFSSPSCLGHLITSFLLSFPFSPNLPFFFLASFVPFYSSVCIFSLPPSYIKFCILSSSLPLVPIDSPPSWVPSPPLYAFAVCCLHWSILPPIPTSHTLMPLSSAACSYTSRLRLGTQTSHVAYWFLKREIRTNAQPMYRRPANLCWEGYGDTLVAFTHVRRVAASGEGQHSTPWINKPTTTAAAGTINMGFVTRRQERKRRQWQGWCACRWQKRALRRRAREQSVHTHALGGVQLPTHILINPSHRRVSLATPVIILSSPFWKSMSWDSKETHIHIHSHTHTRLQRLRVQNEQSGYRGATVNSILWLWYERMKSTVTAFPDRLLHISPVPAAEVNPSDIRTPLHHHRPLFSELQFNSSPSIK